MNVKWARVRSWKATDREGNDHVEEKGKGKGLFEERVDARSRLGKGRGRHEPIVGDPLPAPGRKVTIIPLY